MATIFGALGLADTDHVFEEKVGQRLIYETAQQYLDRLNMVFSDALGFFVERTVEEFKFRYKLPGGGFMQRHNFETQSRPHAVKAVGQWDVALPIDDFRDALSENEIQMAYMTAADLQRHIDTVWTRYAQTMRHEIMRSLFRNTTRTFEDPLQGSLSVEPLANGDAVKYPPTYYNTTEATANHYLESNYAAASISDANNPLVTIRDTLTPHFGYSEGGEDIVVLINIDEIDDVEGLTDFVPLNDRGVMPGDDTATIANRPNNIPGRLVGRSNGVWIYDWSWGIPSGYMYGQHLRGEPPILKRRDPAKTGLGDGALMLIAKDEDHPWETSIWRSRCGFGVGNRLNGVVMELGTGGTYTIPTTYAS